MIRGAYLRYQQMHMLTCVNVLAAEVLAKLKRKVWVSKHMMRNNVLQLCIFMCIAIKCTSHMFNCSLL